ncbi:hypothetical protein ACF1G3_37110 [Streptomyces rochei]|uniref:hypothetical protein n=1 Tax=Streptomyces rochei TaxID=1928 RepID=UPI0036F4F504
MTAFEIHQPVVHTRPLVDTGWRWTAVMESAGFRCQCAGGLCGSRHSNSGMRCKAEHDDGNGRIRLIAAPVDLGLSDVAAAAVPVAQLRAWCPGCFQKARARAREAYANARRIESGPADTLF